MLHANRVTKVFYLPSFYLNLSHFDFNRASTASHEGQEHEIVVLADCKHC